MPEELIAFWEDGDSASEFVEWFGLKYDLDPISQYNLISASVRTTKN